MSEQSLGNPSKKSSGTDWRLVGSQLKHIRDNKNLMYASFYITTFFITILCTFFGGRSTIQKYNKLQTGRERNYFDDIPVLHTWLLILFFLLLLIYGRSRMKNKKEKNKLEVDSGKMLIVVFTFNFFFAGITMFLQTLIYSGIEFNCTEGPYQCEDENGEIYPSEENEDKTYYIWKGMDGADAVCCGGSGSSEEDYLPEECKKYTYNLDELKIRTPTSGDDEDEVIDCSNVEQILHFDIDEDDIWNDANEEILNECIREDIKKRKENNESNYYDCSFYNYLLSNSNNEYSKLPVYIKAHLKTQENDEDCCYMSKSEDEKKKIISENIIVPLSDGDNPCPGGEDEVCKSSPDYTRQRTKVNDVFDKINSCLDEDSELNCDTTVFAGGRAARNILKEFFYL